MGKSQFFSYFPKQLYPRSIWITVEPSTRHTLTLFSVCEEVFSIWLVGEPEASCPTLPSIFFTRTVSRFSALLWLISDVVHSEPSRVVHAITASYDA